MLTLRQGCPKLTGHTDISTVYGPKRSALRNCYKNALNTVKEHPAIMNTVDSSLSPENIREYTENRDWG